MLVPLFRNLSQLEAGLNWVAVGIGALLCVAGCIGLWIAVPDYHFHPTADMSARRQTVTRYLNAFLFGVLALLFGLYPVYMAAIAGTLYFIFFILPTGFRIVFKDEDEKRTKS